MARNENARLAIFCAGSSKQSIKDRADYTHCNGPATTSVTPPTTSPGGSCPDPVWDAAKTYLGWDKMSYQGHRWHAT